MIKELSELKQKLTNSNKKHLMLDIDDTITLTRVHYFRTLMEEHSNPEGLTIQEMISKYQLTNFVPYWKDEKSKQIHERLIHDPHFHENVELLEDADTIINKIHGTVPIAAYLTARPESIYQTTVDWVKRHNLPTVTVISRPDYVSNSNAWKAAVLEYLWPEVIGIVDDNPGLINELHRGYKGALFLYNYAGQEDREGFNIFHCANWSTVETAIQSYLRSS